MQPSLLQALPRGFDFYHLGRIELIDPSQTSGGATPENARNALAMGHFGIGFRLEGEAQGGLVLLVGEGLDASTYSEAGNIIASQLASRLSAEQNIEVTVSPPRILRGHTLKLLLASEEAVVRLYIHRQDGLAIPLQAVVLPATAFSPLGEDMLQKISPRSPEAIGNA
jgi:hypothetical protein